MTKILVMSRHELAYTSRVDESASYALISITDPHSNAPYFQNIFGDSILLLQFYDIDKDLTLLDGTIAHPMSREQGQQIFDFVDKIWNKVDYLVIQCEAGISRSAGIAAAISKFYTGHDDEYFGGIRYNPNRHCYGLLLDILYEDNLDEKSD